MAGTGGANVFAGAGPYVPSYPYPIIPLDTTQLLYSLLLRDVVPSICPNVIAGPADNTSQQAGVCELTPAGQTLINPHVPLKFGRVQIRCMHHQAYQASMIGDHIYALIHTRHREIVTQINSGNQYLIHRTRVVSGPTLHYDTPAVWESLMFAEIVVGTQPVS